MYGFKTTVRFVCIETPGCGTADYQLVLLSLLAVLFDLR
jgi:hypothetical protein